MAGTINLVRLRWWGLVMDPRTELTPATLLTGALSNYVLACLYIHSYSSHPLPQKLPLLVDREHYKKPKWVKMQRINDCELPSPSGYIYKTIPAPEALGTSQKRAEQL